MPALGPGFDRHELAPTPPRVAGLGPAQPMRWASSGELSTTAFMDVRARSHIDGRPVHGRLTEGPAGDAPAADSLSETMDDVLIRQRMGMEDAHYGGGLVDGAYLLELFGDVATELLIRRDGDEGLFRAYGEVDFSAPVYAGDYVEATGEIVGVGRTSREMEFEARKVIEPIEGEETAARVLDEPVVVCRASGTCVVPEERQS